MGRFRYPIIIAALIGLYGIFTLAVLPIAADHTPLCGFCHVPNRAYTTSRDSVHKNIGCSACHRGPGISGAVSSDLRGLRTLAAWISRTPAAEQRVDNDACLRCHDIVLKGTTRSNNIKMSHSQVIEAGWRCADCHGTSGHDLSPVKTALQAASMDKCLYCHSGPGVPANCSLCHTDKRVSEEPRKESAGGVMLTHSARWVESGHGIAPLKTCEGCHDQRSCQKCHGEGVPHKSNWPVFHGSIGRSSDKCRTCHKNRFCDDCHKIKMPHPDGFDQEHTAAGFDYHTCDDCHFRDECRTCHATHLRHRETYKRSRSSKN